MSGGEQRYLLRMFLEELRCVGLWAETDRLSGEPVWLGLGAQGFSVGVVLDMTGSQHLAKGWMATSEFWGMLQDPQPLRDDEEEDVTWGRCSMATTC